jgi:putative ABC transport system ATP-binding protein
VPDALFELQHVSIFRGDGRLQVSVLDGVNLTIARGRITVLIGASGAGKSTALRLLNRFEEPSSGAVLLAGRRLDSYEVLKLRRRVTLLQQMPTLVTDTVQDELRVGCPELGDAGAERLLDQVGLQRSMLHRETAQLSGGEAQRVCLARALALNPEVLLLDEATSGLDRFSAAAVEQTVLALSASGVTVIMVSHDMAQARRVADDLVLLQHGRVVASGPLARLLANDEDLGIRDFMGDTA